MGLSKPIRFSCFAERFALMVSRTLSKNAFTFLADGLINNLPPYLRTFCPRKSKPSEMCVILVFACDSSRPRAARNTSTHGLTSRSSSSFEVPVMMKSSAYLTNRTRSRLIAVAVELNRSVSTVSKPSSTMFAIVGDDTPRTQKVTSNLTA